MGLQIIWDCATTKYAKSRAQWLRTFAEFLAEGTRGLAGYVDQRNAETGDIRAYATVYAAGGGIALTLERGGRLIVDAGIQAAGPGFAEYVCGKMREAPGRFGITVTLAVDDTGCCSGGLRAAQSAQTAWFGNLAAGLLDLLESLPFSRAMWPQQYVPVGHDVVTPYGPWTRAFLEAAASDPADHVASVTPWWQGPFGPAQIVANARAVMWQEIAWRSALDDVELAYQHQVLADLAVAYEQDPTLDYPAAEWVQLASVVGGAYAVPDAITQAAAGRVPTIGYRRGSIWIDWDGWRITYPGALAIGHDPNQPETFQLFDKQFAIRLSPSESNATRVGDALEIDGVAPGSVCDGDSNGLALRWVDLGFDHETKEHQAIACLLKRGEAMLTITLAGLDIGDIARGLAIVRAVVRDDMPVHEENY